MKKVIVRAIECIERDFHRRAFGEELARVNALSRAQRWAYLARLKDRARSSANSRNQSCRDDGSPLV